MFCNNIARGVKKTCSIRQIVVHHSVAWIRVLVSIPLGAVKMAQVLELALFGAVSIEGLLPAESVIWLPEATCCVAAASSYGR